MLLSGRTRALGLCFALLCSGCSDPPAPGVDAVEPLEAPLAPATPESPTAVAEAESPTVTATPAPPTLAAPTPPLEAGSCPEGMILVEGGSYVIGERDPAMTTANHQWSMVTATTIDIAPFCMDRFPFPGIRGAPQPLDGLDYAQVKRLDRILPTFGRRLCLLSESILAAAGPENHRLVYGEGAALPEVCTEDPSAPGPLGADTRCTSALGFGDFHRRAEWGRLDRGDRGEFVLEGDYINFKKSDLPRAYVLFGSASSEALGGAHHNYGVHWHDEGGGANVDDGLRLCADPGPEPLEARWRAALARFRETNRYTSWVHAEWDRLPTERQAAD